MRRLLLLITLLAGGLSPALGSAAEDPFAKAREDMVRSQIERRGLRNQAVLKAMREVPRHLFIPEHLRSQAYRDHPVPIGHGQTISQPYIVAFMTEMVEPKPDHVALEIGTGSGYQAAVLSRCVKEVYTIEIYPELGEAAAKLEAELGYDNITAKVGDGYFGWEEHGPFDIILVTAAATHVPPSLIRQLKEGGKMCIPVGGVYQNHNLILLTKEKDGKIKSRNILPVRFVPLLQPGTEGEFVPRTKKAEDD